jgi:translation initiation factor IF-3
MDLEHMQNTPRRNDMNNDGIKVVANRSIRYPEVRLLGETRELIGVMSTLKALDIAYNKHMDLIELTASAKPPVCFLGSISKYLYEQKQKLKEQQKIAKANARATEMKEIQLRPVTGEADFKRKIGDADEFLKEGHRVKITIQFKGREQAHMNDNITRMVSEIGEVIVNGQLEGNPNYNGNRASLMYIPKKVKQV